MINFNHLTIQQNKRIIINDFSAIIKPGEFVGVLGPNGTGKSTLLRAILGLIKPQKGKIVLSYNNQPLSNTNIGYMPQTKGSIVSNRLSGRARLMACLAGSRYGLPIIAKKDQQRINELIGLVDASHYVDRPFVELSGGERQRLLLAKALLNNPKMLLLDEPLASLDFKQQKRLIKLIAQVQLQFSSTVLLTAHNINALMPALQRVIYIANGQCAIGTVKEVINSKTLSGLYNANIEVQKYNQRILIINHDDVPQFYNNNYDNPVSADESV